MAKQTINLGAHANDRSGDPLRISFGKVNDNFTELYNAAENIPADVVDLPDQNNIFYASKMPLDIAHMNIESISIEAFPGTLIPYNVIEDQVATANNTGWDNTNYSYIVPMDGYYMVNAYIAVDAGVQFGVYKYENETNTLLRLLVAGTYGQSVGGSSLLKLTEGSELRFIAYNNGDPAFVSGGEFTTHMSINMVRSL